MRYLLVAIMFLTASFSSYSSNSETETFKVEKKTVIAIAEALNSGRAKSDDESARLGHILAHDKAVILFSQMIVDLCQNPSKYDFPVEGIDKAECTESQALERVKTDLAYTIGENFMGEVKADKVEDYLNNFLNTYLDKMKAVVEAFNSWM